MLDDVAFWWRTGVWSRLGVQACAAILILVLPWLAYDHYTEPARWAQYKIDHHCVVVYRPGQAGPTADGDRNGNWLYRCDGIPVKRPPYSP